MQYYTRNVVAQFALEVAQSFDVSARQVLEETGLTHSALFQPGGYIPTVKVIEIIDVLSKLSNRSDFGILWGHRADFRSFGALGVVVAHHNTLSKAMAEVGHHVAQLGIGYSLHIKKSAANSILQFQLQVRPPANPVHYVEGMMYMIVRFATLLSNGGWKPAQVQFQHKRLSPEKTYLEAFGCPVAFECDVTAAISPRTSFERSINVAGSPVHEMIQRVLDSAARTESQSLLGKIAIMVPRLLTSGKATAANVALMLNMSPRTLQRRLSEEGKTFKQVVNEAREAIIKDQLQLGTASGGKLASLMGFSEASAASRFVRNHTGKTTRELKSQVRRKV